MGPHSITEIIRGLARLAKLEKMGSIETHRRFEIGNNTNPVVKKEFHGFCDASLNGYGAYVYVKTIYKSGKISVKLLSSKSRVAPLKQETIQRLELLGALLLFRLMLSIRNSLKDEVLFDNVYYWCLLMLSSSLANCFRLDEINKQGIQSIHRE